MAIDKDYGVCMRVDRNVYSLFIYIEKKITLFYTGLFIYCSTFSFSANRNRPAWTLLSAQPSITAPTT